MKERHRSFDLEFKRQAVILANHPDIRTQDVASALAIHPFMLSRWKKLMREGRLEMGRSEKAIGAVGVAGAAKRIRELEREVAQLREENDLLKKLEPSGSRRKRKSSPSSRSTGGGSK